MTQRQARKIACRVAYQFVQKALEVGAGDDTGRSEADNQKIETELDNIAQWLFERSDRGLIMSRLK